MAYKAYKAYKISEVVSMYFEPSIAKARLLKLDILKLACYLLQLVTLLTPGMDI